MSVRLGTVVVDCADPASLAQFWCGVLDWDVVDRDDNGAIEIGAGDQQHVTLLFEPVDEPKQLKNRPHIDLNPSSPSDRSTELESSGVGGRR